MKDISGAAGIQNAPGRDRKSGGRADSAGLVVPKQTALAERDTTDPTTAALKVLQHFRRGEAHLLAEALGDNGHVDE